MNIIQLLTNPRQLLTNEALSISPLSALDLVDITSYSMP